MQATKNKSNNALNDKRVSASLQNNSNRGSCRASPIYLQQYSYCLNLRNDSARRGLAFVTTFTKTVIRNLNMTRFDGILLTAEVLLHTLCLNLGTQVCYEMFGHLYKKWRVKIKIEKDMQKLLHIIFFCIPSNTASLRRRCTKRWAFVKCLCGFFFSYWIFKKAAQASYLMHTFISPRCISLFLEYAPALRRVLVYCARARPGSVE